MDNYTMTFKYDGDFDLPNYEDMREREVPKMVLEKLRSHAFELVDFNLTQNYDSGNARNYIDDPHVNRSVLEIRLDLTKENLKSRERIYGRCLEAMEQEELYLSFTHENENEALGQWQSIIIFDMKKNFRDALEEKQAG